MSLGAITYYEQTQLNIYKKTSPVRRNLGFLGGREQVARAVNYEIQHPSRKVHIPVPGDFVVA